MAAFYDVIENIHQCVNVIIGSHAHVTQPHFYYKDTLVAPQMGNFLFPMHLSSFFVSQYTYKSNSKLIISLLLVVMLLELLKAPF